MRKVHWNKLAQSDYYQNIDYLLREWSEKDAQEFIDEVDEIEYILKTGKVDFQDTNRSDIKPYVICKQNKPAFTLRQGLTCQWLEANVHVMQTYKYKSANYFLNV